MLAKKADGQSAFFRPIQDPLRILRIAKKIKGAAGNTISHSGILFRADNKLMAAVPVHRTIFKHRTTQVPLSVITG
jgi:hypothetical protein